MPEIKKTRIVIASLLKPVDDTRMFEKMGMSLHRNGSYDVHIIGFPSSVKINSGDAPAAHELPRFDRISLKRIFLPLRVLRIVISLKPSVLIITTHELLRVSLLAKILTGCKIIYDVRENYYRNIQHTRTFPPVVRFVIAASVRTKEKLSRMFVDHYWLAEEGYLREISFPGKYVTVIENKIVLPEGNTPVRKQAGEDKLNFLFSGTLAESTGVFTAIEIVQALYEVDSRITLTIIGYAAQRHIAEALHEAASKHSFIRLKGVDRLVPHSQIIEAIRNADVGIIAYPPNPSTENSMPTKLYEYLGLRLPILLIDNPNWVGFCYPLGAAVPFVRGFFDAPVKLKSLRDTSFYPGSVSDVSWESEEKKLLSDVQRLI